MKKYSDVFINRYKSNVHENAGDEEDNHYDVGSSGGQGFVPPFLTVILKRV